MNNASLSEILKVLLSVEEAMGANPEKTKETIETSKSIEELLDRLVEFKQEIDEDGLLVNDQYLSIPSVTKANILVSIPGIVVVYISKAFCDIHLISGSIFKFTTFEHAIPSDSTILISQTVMDELHEYFEV